MNRFQITYRNGQQVHENVLNITNPQENANQSHSENGHPPKDITNANKDVEKREPFCIVGGTANCYSHYGKTVWRCLRKLKLELTHDLAFPLQGVYFICPSCQRIIAALFTTPKTWKQPKCPSTDKEVMTHNTHSRLLKSKSCCCFFHLFK